MKITRGLKAAAKALVAPAKADSFRAGGKLVECPHCENTLFRKRKASLNTALTSLTSMEWTDAEACVLVCANCSRMEWFYENLTAE
jgi:uncharacterized protein